MSKFNFQWDIGAVIDVYLVDDGLIPFEPRLAQEQIYHQCQYLNLIGGGVITLKYRGYTEQTPNYYEIRNSAKPAIYIQFVDPDHSDDFWAWAQPVVLYGTQAKGGTLSFRNDKVINAERFAGILAHELGHVPMRLTHAVSNSIMQNAPYLPYFYQALWQKSDIERLGFGCPLVSSVYDFGNPDPDKCLIHIQCIEIAPDQFVSAYIRGDKLNNGSWEFKANPAEIRSEGFSAYRTAEVLDDKIKIPICYKGQSIDLIAKIHKTNSDWVFKNVELR